jgi:aminopeptidase
MSDIALSTERLTSHDQKLNQLAEVAIRVGLGLKAGQELVMTASIDSLPLARRIT